MIITRFSLGLFIIIINYFNNLFYLSSKVSRVFKLASIDLTLINNIKNNF